MADENEKKTQIATNLYHESEPEVAEGKAAAEDKPELSPQDELEAIRQEAAEYKDKYLRAAAEVENTRKRLERQYANQAEEEKKRLLRAFLTVADNLERALAYADCSPAAQEESLRDGVQLTYQELQRLLSREGVEPMQTIGQPFDPYYHEAVARVVGDHDEEIVIKERQKGYLYHGELLRPARVEVAVPAPKES